MQDRVVTDVMAALEVKVDSSAMERIAPPETLHLEAYEEYAQGRQQFNAIGKESLERARQHLERAVALDPNYALAYAALGATHAMRYIHRTDPADLDYAVAIPSAPSNLITKSANLIHGWVMPTCVRGKFEQVLGAGRKGGGAATGPGFGPLFSRSRLHGGNGERPQRVSARGEHLLDAT